MQRRLSSMRIEQFGLHPPSQNRTHGLARTSSASSSSSDIRGAFSFFPLAAAGAAAAAGLPPFFPLPTIERREVES
jgi:hypothetical protein